MTFLHDLAFTPATMAVIPVLETTILFLAGQILLIATLFHLLPGLTRRDILFAVTVDPAYRKTAESRRVVRQFRIAVWIHSAVGTALVFAGAATSHLSIPFVGVLWQLVGAMIAFLRARKQTLPHAVSQTARREAVLVRRSAGVGYWLLQLGPFAILAASAFYLKYNWQRIPERFPVHWGLSGEPDGWATRSFTGVYAPLLIAFAVCALIAVLSYAILHWTRQVRATGPAGQAEGHFRQVQFGILLAVQYFLAGTLSGVPILALRAHQESAPGIGPFLVGTFVFVLVIFAILIYTGQGGANLAEAAIGSDIVKDRPVTGDRTPDQCWKAGMFYVNPDDPALLVEKRFGVGYTINFGHPAAWIVISILVALAVVPLIISFFPAHSH
ncbi:MAG TPA: DUF5808 domain-containing protein [Candidatus Acidoferrum sp.]|nr:DUF5808 domain-containing protein [Candidatus Acidoferrum sp.]